MIFNIKYLCEAEMRIIRTRKFSLKEYMPLAIIAVIFLALNFLMKKAQFYSDPVS